MITSISKYQDNKQKEKEIIKKLVEDFNKTSKEQNSKYKLFLLYDFEAILIKPIFWDFGNRLGEHKIFYNSFSDEFSFYEGIDKEIFEDIESILKNLKQKFKIEVI